MSYLIYLAALHLLMSKIKLMIVITTYYFKYKFSFLKNIL